MAKVKIQGHASGTGVLTVTAPNTSTDRTITLPDSTGTLATTADTGVAGITSSADATAMTITSDEKIGIGTASPAYALHIDGTSLGGRFMLENTANGNTGIFMKVSNSGTQVGNSTIRQENNGDISIYQGTTSEALRATLKQGGGICFNSDTATANALDDYEEGTWTPAWSSGANGRSISGTGGYTKVGNLVTVYGFFEIGGSNNTGSGDVSFSGLPFTSTSVSAQRSAISIYVNKCASAVDGYISGLVYQNSQNFYVREGGIVSDGADLGNHFDQDTDFYLSASYRV